MNSEIRSKDNFLCEQFFLFQKIKADSVNDADSRDTKLLIEYPGNPILAQFSKLRGWHSYAWVFHIHNRPIYLSNYTGHFYIS